MWKSKIRYRKENFFSWIKPSGKRHLGTTEIDLVRLSYAAMVSTLSSKNLPISFFSWFLDLLTKDKPELIWRGNGAGDGSEIRRGYSAIFGRFFASYYLYSGTGAQYLFPIEGKKPVNIHNAQFFIDRIPILPDNKKASYPDLIGFSNRETIIAEAKGSHSYGEWGNYFLNKKKKDLPDCLETAVNQVEGARINLEVRNKSKVVAIDLPFTGLAIASRWAVETKKYKPWLAVVKSCNLGDIKNSVFTNFINYNLQQFAIIRMLDSMGHLTSQEIDTQNNEEFTSIDLISEKMIPIYTRVGELFGILSIVGRFGIIPITNVTQLLSFINFRRVFKNNNTFAIMLDHELVQRITSSSLYFYKKHKGVVNFLSQAFHEKFRNSDLQDFDLGEIDYFRELFYERYFRFQSVFSEDTDSAEIEGVFMRNGLAMIDINSINIERFFRI